MTDYLSRGWHTSPRGTATAGTMPRVGPAEQPAPAGAEPGEPAPTTPGH
jgi:hypothetical protein